MCVFQSKDKYFLESGDQIRFFFEEDALDKDGNLIVEQDKSLNKVTYTCKRLVVGLSLICE